MTRHTRHLSKIFSGAVLLLLCMVAPLAQAEESAAAQASIITGPETGTYHLIGKDIARVSELEGLALETTASHGSVENIKRLTDSKGTLALAVVQSDVLGFLKRSLNPGSRERASHLRLVAPLYQEEIHVLARKEIKSVKDLDGKRVIIGKRGSGHMLTAMNILNVLNLQPEEYLHMTPPEGVVAVLAGEADALFFTGGQPVPLFKNMEELRTAHGGESAHLLDAVHFLPLEDARLFADYDRAVLSTGNYEMLPENVPTVSVSSVLISYDFSSGNDVDSKRNCKKLGIVGRAIRDHMEALKAKGHPKWKEVNVYRRLGIWQRDVCAWQEHALKPAQSSATDETAHER